MASHQDISDRLRFLSIDADTRSQLAAFLPVIQRELPGILKGFYAHLGQWPELTRMFEGPSASARAEKAQGEHWMKLFSGRFDDGYTESVRRIGLMHSRIGLEPRFYMGGYAFILNHLYAVASRMHASRMQPGGAQARTAALLRALNQAVMLDMDLAISIYIDENKATFERKLGGLSDSFASRVGPLVGEVATQAASLKSAAVSITDTARRTAQQASLVASAAREASGGVGTVAAAAEQLATSVDEIARQVAHSSAMTQQAVDTTHRTDGFVRALASGAQKIGEVVGLIDTVAAQTNLLALNATIEAARAGEAGKGFAVVASEVKSLAGQTRSATEVIGQQVNEMQSATRNVVEAIGGITAAISELNKVATAIAAAVEQQGAATREISRSVQETAAGTRQVTDNISRVDEGVRATGDAAAAALRVAESQEQQADKLRSEVAAFVTQIRAA